MKTAAMPDGAETKATVISLLSMIGFCGIFSTTISKNPVLPLFLESMGAGTDVIGAISAISPLAGILFSFPVGLLADRLGRKRLLIVSAFVFLLAPVLYLFVRDPWWIIPVRFFHGVATAILGPVSAALILGAYRDTKGEKLGIYSSATLVGRTLAPILGGAIISGFASFPGDWNYRFVYVAAFLLAIPVFVLSFMMPNDASAESGIRKVTLADFGTSLLAFVANGRLLGTALVEMAACFTYGAFETYLPLYLQGRGLPPYQIGLVFSLRILAVALSKPLFGRPLCHWRRHPGFHDETGLLRRFLRLPRLRGRLRGLELLTEEAPTVLIGLRRLAAPRPRRCSSGRCRRDAPERRTIPRLRPTRRTCTARCPGGCRRNRVSPPHTALCA